MLFTMAKLYLKARTDLITKKLLKSYNINVQNFTQNKMCPGGESNPHVHRTPDPKSGASTNSATRA